jgi:hypothetical protein
MVLALYIPMSFDYRFFQTIEDHQHENVAKQQKNDFPILKVIGIESGSQSRSRFDSYQAFDVDNADIDPEDSSDSRGPPGCLWLLWIGVMIGLKGTP